MSNISNSLPPCAPRVERAYWITAVRTGITAANHWAVGNLCATPLLPLSLVDLIGVGETDVLSGHQASQGGYEEESPGVKHVDGYVDDSVCTRASVSTRSAAMLATLDHRKVKQEVGR